MHRFLLLMALSGCLSHASAQITKINPAGLHSIYMYENAPASSRTNDNVRESVFITLNNGYSLDDLLDFDIEEQSMLSKNVYIISIPVKQALSLADNKAVNRIAFPQTARPLLNKARAYCNVDQVQAGTDLNQAYDGTGVLAGIYDTGLDPNSPVFKSFPDGTSRVKAFFNGSTNREYAADEISSATTDNENATHGTHCASIMAGASSMPRATISSSGVASANESTGVTTIKPMSSGYPYGGVAPGADLYLSGGTLTTTQTILACQKIIDYAKANGQPAVINLSLGVTTGPHDGSTDFNQAIEEMSKDAIFCISAGNEGDTKCSVEKTFTATDNELKSFVLSNTSGSLAKVDTDIEYWADNADEMNITFSLYNTQTNSIIYSYPVGSKGWSVLETADIHKTGYDTDATFSKYFAESTVQLWSGLESNNRYMVYAYLDLTPTSTNGNTVLPVITVSGSAGQYVYGNIGSPESYQFASRDLTGYTDGNADNSINDWACAPSVISVGAMATRKYFPTLTKQYLGWSSVQIGDISYFSSYGKTFDGRKLPVVVAPGQVTIAALNSYYTDALDYESDSNYASAYLSYAQPGSTTTRKYYWEEMQGTSMSSPFAAGTIALWLQAHPALTVDDVLDIIKQTSVKNEYYNNQPDRWGYGYIDALAGIKLAIEKSGIADIEQDADLSLIVKPVDGRTFDIYLKDAGSMVISLYTVTGTQVASMNVSGDNATVSAPGNQPGIMIMRIVTPTGTFTRKLAVR